jgi:hypothetical protein
LPCVFSTAIPSAWRSRIFLRSLSATYYSSDKNWSFINRLMSPSHEISGYRIVSHLLGRLYPSLTCDGCISTPILLQINYVQSNLSKKHLPNEANAFFVKGGNMLSILLFLRFTKLLAKIHFISGLLMRRKHRIQPLLLKWSWDRGRWRSNSRHWC